MNPSHTHTPNVDEINKIDSEKSKTTKGKITRRWSLAKCQHTCNAIQHHEIAQYNQYKLCRLYRICE